MIYTEKTEEAKINRMKEGGIPWRISSTLFSHLRYDSIMKPLDPFMNAESKKKYPEMTVEEHTKMELEMINLRKWFDEFYR